MTMLRFLLFLACALACTACSDPRHDAERRLQRVGAARLRHDAAILYKEMYSGHKRDDFKDVWYKTWPRSFQEFAPRHVGAYLDGFALGLHADVSGASGLFVVPESMDREPKAEPGTIFFKLTDGVYWYSFLMLDSGMNTTHPAPTPVGDPPAAGQRGAPVESVNPR